MHLLDTKISQPNHADQLPTTLGSSDHLPGPTMFPSLQPASTYTFDYPPNSLPSSVVEFTKHFYANTDNPTAHEEYADLYVPEASLVVASMSVKGHDQILAFHTKSWEGVKHRLHTIEKVFPYPSPDPEKEVEVMLYGTSAYEFLDGRKGVIEWAGRARYVSVEGVGWRNGGYRVYLDTQKSALQKANEKFGPGARE